MAKVSVPNKTVVATTSGTLVSKTIAPAPTALIPAIAQSLLTTPNTKPVVETPLIVAQVMTATKTPALTQPVVNRPLAAPIVAPAVIPVMPRPAIVPIASQPRVVEIPFVSTTKAVPTAPTVVQITSAASASAVPGSTLVPSIQAPAYTMVPGVQPRDVKIADGIFGGVPVASKTSAPSFVPPMPMEPVRAPMTPNAYSTNRLVEAALPKPPVVIAPSYALPTTQPTIRADVSWSKEPIQVVKPSINVTPQREWGTTDVKIPIVSVDPGLPRGTVDVSTAKFDMEPKLVSDGNGNQAIVGGGAQSDVGLKPDDIIMGSGDGDILAKMAADKMAAQAAAGSSSNLKPLLIAGGVGLGLFFLYKALKKKGKK